MYSTLMPNWCLFLIIFQLWIVYTFGALAKIYPDWLNGTTIGILMQNKADYFIIGNLLQSSNLQWFLGKRERYQENLKLEKIKKVVK